MLFHIFWVLVPYETQVDIPFVSKNWSFMKICKYRHYSILKCTRMKFVPTVSVKRVPVPYYHAIFSRIMCFLTQVFTFFVKSTLFWVHFDPFSAILPVKITNIWDTNTRRSKHTTLSDIANQLTRKYTKRWKSTDVYLFSWIFSFKKLEKYWKMAKIPLPRPQILYVFI